jgi:hypothetical protein
MKETKSQMGLGGAASRDPRRALAARERWVDRVLAHVPRAELEECLSFWLCMEMFQERKVTDIESARFIWTPTAGSGRRGQHP